MTGRNNEAFLFVGKIKAFCSLKNRKSQCYPMVIRKIDGISLKHVKDSYRAMST